MSSTKINDGYSFSKSMMDEEAQREYSEYDMKYAEKVAKHLATHYMNGVWAVNGSDFSSDVPKIQNEYLNLRKDSVKRFEARLNNDLKSFFRIGKKNKGINLAKLLEILAFKFYHKPKRKFVCYLWDIDYDIHFYNLMNKKEKLSQ